MKVIALVTGWGFTQKIEVVQVLVVLRHKFMDRICYPKLDSA